MQGGQNEAGAWVICKRRVYGQWWGPQEAQGTQLLAGPFPSPKRTDELDGSTGKKPLIANGVKNGKGTQRAVTTMGLGGLVGSRESVFLACGSREQRENQEREAEHFNPT